MPFIFNMECLIDYIGLKGCGNEQPDSGLFINELYGVQFESIQKIADSEQKTFAGVWADVQKRGVNKLSTAVTNWFRTKYQIKTISESFDLGKKIENTTLAGANEYRGFAIELQPENAFNSNLANTYVQTLQLYLSAPANTTVKIFDLDLGSELFSVGVTGVAGWNLIKVNQNFSANRIFCGYLATVIASVKLDISEQLSNDFGCFCNDYFNCEARVRGGILESPFTDYEASYNTHGFTGVFGARCTYNNIVCNNKDVFKLALWYLFGHELMCERIYTPRLNRFTTIDLEKAKQLRDEFKNEFERELSNAIQGIKLNVNDCCLECDAIITYKESRM